MESYKVRIYPAAEQDLVDIVDYLNTLSADAALRIYDKITEEIAGLSQMPERCPRPKDLALAAKGYRYLIVENYLVFYVVEGDVENIKVTYPSDIFMADRLFQIRSVIYPQEQILDNVKDKVIVIFGGTSGIGLCTAELAQKYGAKVYSASTGTGCDITDYDSVEKVLKDVFEKYGRIDCVINSAGILRMGKLVERNIEDIQKDINVNYTGSINVVKASIPYLKETKGTIQLYASSSYTRGRALYSTYSSTKAGIVNLAQALAEELACDNIRVNVINPERCATPMRFKAFGKEPEGSLLQPEKVAEASLKTMLSNLTGQVIDVRRG